MKLLTKIGIWGLLAGGTASALYADPVGGWLSPNGVGGGASMTASGSVAGSASGTVGVTMNLSLADMQTRVHQLHDQTRADARHIQHLQQVARKEKDIIKLNCVNDKLVQVKPQMNIADAAEAELEGSKDTDRMTIFETVSQATENVRRLREEADQCIGEPLAPDDPTKGFAGNEIEPPGYASPYN
jgi:hypothetical protein